VILEEKSVRQTQENSGNEDGAGHTPTGAGASDLERLVDGGSAGVGASEIVGSTVTVMQAGGAL
jgi:hypothetical protein